MPSTVSRVGTFARCWRLERSERSRSDGFCRACRASETKRRSSISDFSTNNNRVDIAAEGLDYAIRLAAAPGTGWMPSSFPKHRSRCSVPRNIGEALVAGGHRPIHAASVVPKRRMARLVRGSRARRPLVTAERDRVRFLHDHDGGGCAGRWHMRWRRPSCSRGCLRQGQSSSLSRPRFQEEATGSRSCRPGSRPVRWKLRVVAAATGAGSAAACARIPRVNDSCRLAQDEGSSRRMTFSAISSATWPGWVEIMKCAAPPIVLKVAPLIDMATMPLARQIAGWLCAPTATDTGTSIAASISGDSDFVIGVGPVAHVHRRRLDGIGAHAVRPRRVSPSPP